jgi:Haem-binding uptake, Tiki superfamily, ChaN
MRNFVSRLPILSVALVQGLVGECCFKTKSRGSSVLHSRLNNEPEEPSLTRRDACFRAVVAGVGVFSSDVLGSELAWAADGDYQPAKRPTAYRVDSTQPPTLIPISNARHEAKILADLGKGRGTDKDAILDDRVNLNNMMNKAIFGSIDAVSALGAPKDESREGEGYASFVCVGVPTITTADDVDLAVGVLSPILQARKGDGAVGLSILPLSSQPDLDSFLKSGDEGVLSAALISKGVTEPTAQLYLPLFQFAKKNSLPLLAMSPEMVDIQQARSQGLQNVNAERRASYVVDTDGFIALSQDQKFRLYADRSLLKDWEPLNNDDKAGSFFAERILVHEAAATAAARFAVSRPDSLVAIVAPMRDVRYMGGINRRIPRVFGFLTQGDTNKVTDTAVTTILLNPTAKDTLSKSRYLRLEIGTGPETLDLQTKVADYLWFSSTPKVNMIPRLMNG